MPRRQRRNNKKLIQGKPYSLKQTVQRLGPGSTTVRVTQRYTYTGLDEDAVVNFMRDVVDNAEFEDKLVRFKYFRIQGVKIIMVANNKVGATASGRISLDWNSNILENIYKDDGAKEFPNYLTRNVVFRFLTPNANLSMSDGRTINYAAWTPTNFPMSNAIPPGFIKISAAFAFTFTTETLIIFKGSQTEFTPNKVIGRKEEDIKEEEIKENEEVKDDEQNIKDINELIKKIKLNK